MNVFWISIGKGCLFILVTGFLLYKFIYKNMKDIENREKQLNSLVENNMDAIMRLDLNGNFITVNPVTGKITGYSEEELIKMSFKDLISKEDLDKVQKQFLEIRKRKVFNRRVQVYDQKWTLYTSKHEKCTYCN